MKKVMIMLFAFSGSVAAQGGGGELLQQGSQALFGTDGSWQFILLAFLTGVLTSFLPCIYPMIPITISILQVDQVGSLRRSFLLSLAYVLGIATVYASLGYVCAKTSLLFGSWLSSAWLVGGVVLFFLYLAGAMLGLYELFIPRLLLRQEGASARGSALRSFFLGMVAASVASPCLTPPLAVLIGMASREANPLLAFAALFAFSLGMGVLLLVIGTFSAALSVLPRASQWMDEVKRFMGFVMVGASINFASALLPSWTTWLLYAGVFAAGGAWYGLMSWRSMQAGRGLTAGLSGLVCVVALALAFWCGWRVW